MQNKHWRSYFLSWTSVLWNRFSSGLQTLTCAMTPGLRGKGWMAGAWVTSGSVLSMRTEYPGGWFGLDPIPGEKIKINNNNHLVFKYNNAHTFISLVKCRYISNCYLELLVGKGWAFAEKSQCSQTVHFLSVRECQDVPQVVQVEPEP